MKLGKSDLNDVDEVGSIEVAVSEFFIHPDWISKDDDDTSYDADIALVLLMQTVTFSDVIQPICLPESSQIKAVGEGTVVGWGSTSLNENHSSILKKMKVPIVNGTHCYTSTSELASYGSDRMFCAGYKNEGKSVCAGDSGSGLYQKDDLTEDSWVLSGIVSGSLLSNSGGCNVDSFALYTNVASFLDWISSVENSNEKTQT